MRRAAHTVGLAAVHPVGPLLALFLALLLALLLAPPAAAQETTLRARSGDGIWHLLVRAGIRPTGAAIEAFKELNEGRLLRGEQLVAGRGYAIPEGVGRRATVVPALGPRYERVERRSDRLAGHVYYLLSGHGGPDPGAIGRHAGRPFPEDEVAYDVTLRLARRLIEEGATVHLIVQDPDDGIRDGTRFALDRDERYQDGRAIAGNHVRRLRDRVALINRLYREDRATAKRQILLSLHVDARGSRREPPIDVHFQVASRRSERLARRLADTFREQYARVQPGRGYGGTVEYRNLYVLKRTRPAAVLVELGNIRHPRDQVRLVRASNRQALAEWLARGLLREAAGGR